MTKNKKKKEREAALKMKKETGARKKENPKGSETKVIYASLLNNLIDTG